MASTMFALVFSGANGGIEKNMYVDKAAPRPPAIKDGETLVRVAYAAINPVDFKLPELPYVGYLTTSVPASPGLDFSGRVVETKNPNLKPGQLVFGRRDQPGKHGTLAEYTVAPLKGVVALPPNVSLKQGASIATAALAAWQMIAPNVKGKPPGQRVLINGGSGGTGTWAIQIAKAMSAHVTTTCSTPNVALCKELGADEVIDYRNANVSQTLVDKASADPSHQYDLVADMVGQPLDLYKSADTFLKASGRYTQIGGEPNWEFTKNLFLGEANNIDDLNGISALVASGEAKPIIDSVHKLEDAPKAFEKLKTNRARGKILVEVGGESV